MVCSIEFMFSWAPLSTSCSRILASRSRSNSAVESERNMLCVSSMSATVAAAVCFDSSTAAWWRCADPRACARCRLGRLGDALGAFLQLAEACASSPTVAFWLASLMSRAISSLLSIIVWVKTKLLASIDFTAWSVTRLTSPANSWPLPDSAASSPFDFSSSRCVISPSRSVTADVEFVGPADDVARDLGAGADQTCARLRWRCGRSPRSWRRRSGRADRSRLRSSC